MGHVSVNVGGCLLDDRRRQHIHAQQRTNGGERSRESKMDKSGFAKGAFGSKLNKH